MMNHLREAVSSINMGCTCSLLPNSASVKVFLTMICGKKVDLRRKYCAEQVVGIPCLLWSLQAMLQEFVWSERQRRERMQQREKRLTALGAGEMIMPLFCFQTAIKSFYFAALIYEYQEVSRHIVSLPPWKVCWLAY